MTEQIDYKARCEEYEKRMGIGENDPAKDGYLVLVKLLRQQNDYLNSFDISLKIGQLAKEDAVYPRAKEMWSDLPAMITKVSNLRIELKMDGEEKKSTYVRASPKAIADGTANI
jgi:hypothetical protein